MDSTYRSKRPAHASARTRHPRAAASAPAEPATATSARPTQEGAQPTESAHSTRKNAQPARKDVSATADNAHIVMSWDWGTGRFSACWAVCFDGRTIREDDLVDISFFQRAGYQPPMMMAYHAGQYIWGYELEGMVLNGAVGEERVLDHLKLELYEQRDEFAEARCKALGKQLADMHLTVDGLITAHLRAVMQDCMSAIVDSEPTIPEDELRRMQVRVRLSVPQMWSMPARQRMQNAAEAAGLTLVLLVSEPENAMAFCLQQLVKKEKRYGAILRKGDRILVADLGCGTADIVTYMLQGPLTLTSPLEAVSSSCGGACGAQMINEILFDAVRTRIGQTYEGGLKALHENLGLSRIQFRKKALRFIDGAKNQFPVGQSFSYVVRGKAGKYFILDLSHDDIKSAFDKVLGKIKALMDTEIGDQNPAMMFCTGGLSRNKYVLSALREEYEDDDTKIATPNDVDQGECLPVSRGGLLRFDRIAPAKLPSNYNYAIVQREVYDEKLHPDAKANAKLVYCDPADPETDIVEDRLHIFFRKGRVMPRNRSVTEDFSHVYLLDEHNPTLSATLVFTEKDVDNHDPSGRKGEDSTQFSEGIHHWKTVSKVIDLDLLSEHGIDLVKIKKDGSKRWRLDCRVTISYKGGHDMKIGWVLKVGNDKLLALWEGDEKVWDAHFSQFIEQPRLVAANGGTTDVDGDAEMADDEVVAPATTRRARARKVVHSDGDEEDDDEQMEDDDRV
ncbi:hypothetical protein LTR97_007295 [Elasticomyces elasticus]|uniref:Uncharacterized protein n=1 Tax=Elasticomyces elasticus TaxID=574655 RepID=A0AAN7WEA0_9PEZI|nr:hypothetical protein LTR97_007295 [Elasticomyces elasticus]